MTAMTSASAPRRPAPFLPIYLVPAAAGIVMFSSAGTWSSDDPYDCPHLDWLSLPVSGLALLKAVPRDGSRSATSHSWFRILGAVVQTWHKSKCQRVVGSEGPSVFVIYVVSMVTGLAHAKLFQGINPRMLALCTLASRISSDRTLPVPSELVMPQQECPAAT